MKIQRWIFSVLLISFPLLGQNPGLRSGESYAPGSGTANAQTVAVPLGITSLYDGLGPICWKPTAANTNTTPTLAVNGLAATTITKFGNSALSASPPDLTTTAAACVIYVLSTWQLQNPQSNTVGVPAFSAIASGTNTVAAMLVGSGASLGVAGSGTIGATSLVSLSGLPSQSANTVLGTLTATTPSALAMPSCSGASNALIWTSGTGFGCNTISGGGSSAFSSLTSGTNTTAAMVVGTGASLGVAGSGAITATTISGGLANQINYQSAANTTAFLSAVNSAVVSYSSGGTLQASTTLPTGLAMGTPASIVLTNATGTASSLTAGLATSMTGGAAGSLPYQTAAGTSAFIAANSTGSTDAVLTSTSVSGSYSSTALKNAPVLAVTNMTGTGGFSITGNATSATNMTGGTANSINYQTATNTTAFLSAVASAVVSYSSGGGLQASTTLPTGLAMQTPASLVCTNCSGTAASLTVGHLSALTGMPTQATNTVVMNATSGTAAPTAVAMPTCTSGADLYNTSTQTWSCVAAGTGNVSTTGTTTASYFPIFGSPTTGITNGHLDDGATTSSVITSTETMQIAGDGTHAGEVGLAGNTTPRPHLDRIVRQSIPGLAGASSSLGMVCNSHRVSQRRLELFWWVPHRATYPK